MERWAIATADIAAILRLSRHEIGLTQEELARLSGVSVRTISDLECGRVTNPRQSTLRSLAQSLQLSDEEMRHLRLLARGLESLARQRHPITFI